ASAAGSAGVFIVAVFGLFTRYGGPTAAFTTILVGALSWLVFGFLELETPYIAALALALATYLGDSALEKRSETAERLIAGCQDQSLLFSIGRSPKFTRAFDHITRARNQ